METAEEICTNPSAETADPVREKDLRLNEDPRCTKSITDKDWTDPTFCNPCTLREDPSLPKLRTEIEEFKVEYCKTETYFPTRTKERTERELPKCAKSSTDNSAPPCIFPCTLQALPTRAKWRMDKEDPMFAKFNKDIAELRRLKLLRETLDPRSIN
jgi:hypothetical protein